MQVDVVPVDGPQAQEIIEAKVLKGPVAVTAAEREAHEATGHAEYRSWCIHCVAAKGRA